MANILKEVELKEGGSAYVQFTNKRGSISFDNPQMSFSIWLTKEELYELEISIHMALKEASNE